MSMEDWDRCECDITIESLAGRACFGGLDLSSTRDLSCCALVFPFDDGRAAVLLRTWVPEANLRKKGFRDHAPYQSWDRLGKVTITPGRPSLRSNSAVNSMKPSILAVSRTWLMRSRNDNGSRLTW